NTFLVVSDNGGQSFTPVLKRCAVRGPLACTSSCAPEWPAMAALLNDPCPPPSEAGIPDASMPADGGTINPPAAGCGCTASPALPDFGIVALLIFSSRPLWARAARRRARTQRP